MGHRSRMEIGRRVLRSRFFWWLILTLGCAVFATIKLDIPRYYFLTSRGVQTIGQVTSKDPEEHGTVHYSYVVEGKSYTWGGFSGDIDRDFDEIKAGDPVPCVYDPVKPSSSSLGDPRPQFDSLVRGAIFFTLFPTLFWIFYNIQTAIKRR